MKSVLNAVILFLMMIMISVLEAQSPARSSLSILPGGTGKQKIKTTCTAAKSFTRTALAAKTNLTANEQLHFSTLNGENSSKQGNDPSMGSLESHRQKLENALQELKDFIKENQSLKFK